MNLRLLIAVAMSLFVSSTLLAQDLKTLKTEKEKKSYSVGMNIGESFKQQGVDIDPAVLAQGIKDVMNGSPLLTPEQMKEALTALQIEMMANQQKKMKAVGEQNMKEGATFLATNKKEKDVVTLPSGLQYKVLKEGKGKKPGAADSVVSNYEGRLIDGTVFDSSSKRGEPATFNVGGVIKGWTEILQKMSVGSKYQVFIPSELAYGERGAGQVIGPHAVLIFDIELLEIK